MKLIFIVKHNNIYLLLPHLLHVDSIVKIGGGATERFLSLKVRFQEKIKMIFVMPTFICYSLTRGLTGKIVRILREFRKSRAPEAALDVLANEVVCNDRRLMTANRFFT